MPPPPAPLSENGSPRGRGAAQHQRCRLVCLITVTISGCCEEPGDLGPAAPWPTSAARPPRPGAGGYFYLSISARLVQVTKRSEQLGATQTPRGTMTTRAGLLGTSPVVSGWPCINVP